MRHSIAWLVVLLISPAAWSQQKPEPVRAVANEARASIVSVTTEDRDGDESGLGTGFVIDSEGLIATNLHVIGEARPVWVELRNGKRYEVTEIHASDRTLDLAILRIHSDDKLRPLPLSSTELADGQATVAIGHPLGFKNSVVSGVVAGERDFGGAAMWQVAMTIEPGNSGGPLLDMQGKVHGVISMKSTGREPFGFAVKVKQLRKLIEKPNPIAIAQWKTIGQIDPERWQAKMGARWTQRSGRIMVENPGDGFGGRALLLRVDKQPELPFEVAVSVRLDDETGAAGLVFHSDDESRHYGFYPSSGGLRLTSFEGPNVFSWHVVREVTSTHYKPGDWNEIKVRVEKDQIIGFVNGHEVVRVDEVRQPAGRIGLCKFRHTKATFKGFRFGETVSSRSLAPDELDRLTAELSRLGKRSRLLDMDLTAHGRDVLKRMTVLEDQARTLDQQADELRKLSREIHVISVCDELKSIVNPADDAEIDLLRGALWIAKLDNAELDVDLYAQTIDSMASAVRKRFTETMKPQDRLAALDHYLFQENGYHGSRTDYYHEANSHLDRVIDDREGLPITLSVLYISLAQRLGLNVVGVGLPGHFVVRHEPAGEPSQLVDVFERGERLSKNQANVLAFRMAGRPPSDQDFAAATHRAILVRMLTNLYGVAQGKQDNESTLRYLEALIAVVPKSEPDLFRLRGQRAVLRHQQGRKRAAVEDLDWILEQKPEGLDLAPIRSMREMFAR